MPSDAIAAHLARVAEYSGAPDPRDAGARLAALARLIHAWNQRLNLTGHPSVEAIARRLVAPAAGLASVLPETVEAIADLGSGAGIPGVPVALVRPHEPVTLVDSRERRHFFQRQAIRSLGLAGRVEALRQRAEVPPPRRFGLVLSQAMAPPDRALRWMTDWAIPGGWLALPLNRPADAPRPRAAVPPGEVVAYRLPGEGSDRWVWLARLDPG